LGKRRWSLVVRRWPFAGTVLDWKAGGNSMPATFKDLRVWQEAMKLAIDVYRSTTKFPKYELYGLSQQLRRAAVSVPSNIAEGKGHRSDREFGQFLLHARGSMLEVQTQLSSLNKCST
jgi:four helix bundle protein